MSKQKPTYRISPPGDRIRIWGADGRALARSSDSGHRGGGNRKVYSNSLGGQSFMTVARSIFKAPQQMTDRGGGYVMVRWADDDAALGRLSEQK